MVDITLDTAALNVHSDWVIALNWYKHLSFEQRQAYIDSLGIHRVRYIQQFTVDTMWFVSEYGENGFDLEALTDLWQRIRHRLRKDGLGDDSG